MKENSRPHPGPAAHRDPSQGQQRRPSDGGSAAAGGDGQAGSGSRRRRRRSRGGKNRSQHRGEQQTGKQGSGQHNQSKQGEAKQGQSKQGQSKQGQTKQGEAKQSGQQGKQNGTKQQPKQSGAKGAGGQKRRRRSRGKGANGRPNGRGQSHQPRHRQQYQNRYDSSIDTRDETSAGGLVVSGMAEAVASNGEVDLSQIYAALIGRLDRRGRLLWSMPKGHVEEGEHQWSTAEREVWEETGIEGEAFDTLGTIDYWFVSEGVRIHKTVHHNLLRFVDGELNDEDPEVTEVSWVPMSELIERLAYADERKLARIAVDRMPDLARKEAAAGRATPR